MPQSLTRGYTKKEWGAESRNKLSMMHCKAQLPDSCCDNNSKIYQNKYNRVLSYGTGTPIALL